MTLSVESPSEVVVTRQVRGQALVAKVMDATIAELARVGYESISIEQVAVVAGVNKTTLYRRWATRRELVRAALSQPLIALTIALFIVASLYHMRLGMQIIIEDYIHAEGMKLALLILNTFFAIAVGVATGFSLLKLAFGG